MSKDSGAFPTRSQLWRGAVLGTVAEAIWAAANPEAYDQQWIDHSYVYHDGQGDDAVVTFGQEGTVGLCFDHESDRNPLPREREQPYDWRPLLEGIPSCLFRLAERASFPHMLYPYRERRVPMITAAFWGTGETMTASESWPDVYRNGANVLRIQLMPPELAFAEWQVNYEFSPAQAVALRSLYRRRMLSADIAIRVEPWERRAFVQVSDIGIEHSRKLLAAIGIVLP